MYRRLGGLENADGLYLYWPLLLVSVVTVNAVLVGLLLRRGHPLPRLALFQLSISFGGFAGAKLYSIVFRGRVEPLIQELESGWRYPGALLGMLAAVWIARRLLPEGLSPKAYLDVWAPSILLALAIGRFACLLNGCCAGSPSDVPWAITYPQGSLPWYDHVSNGLLDQAAHASAAVHPFPVYLMMMELALAALLFRRLGRAKFEGEIVLQFLAFHGLAKGALEFFRDPFSPFHLLVVPIGVAALFLLGWSARDGRAFVATTAMATAPVSGR